MIRIKYKYNNIQEKNEKNFMAYLVSSVYNGCSSVRWQAQWIMHPEVAPQSHAVVLFRKTF